MSLLINNQWEIYLGGRLALFGWVPSYLGTECLLQTFIYIVYLLHYITLYQTECNELQNVCIMTCLQIFLSKNTVQSFLWVFPIKHKLGPTVVGFQAFKPVRTSVPCHTNSHIQPIRGGCVFEPHGCVVEVISIFSSLDSLKISNA